MYSRALSLFVALACTAFVNAAPVGDVAPLDIIPAGVLGQATPNVPTDVASHLAGVPRAGVDTITGLIPAQLEGVASGVHLPGIPRSLRNPLNVAGHLPGVLSRAGVDDIAGLIPSQLEGAASGVHLPSIPRSLVDSVRGDKIPVRVPVNTEVKDVHVLRQLDRHAAHPLVGLIRENVEETAGDLIEPSLVDAAVELLNREDEHPSLPEIFKGLVVKISPISNQLKAAVSLKADISVELVVTLLNEVIVILTEALVDVQYIVDNPTGFVLSVAGTILSIKEVAFIVATLLTLVIPLLFTVVAAVEGAAVDLVLPLVATIGSLVASLLSLALALVPGLLALLFPLVASLVSTIYYLRLADVVAILGLPALA